MTETHEGIFLYYMLTGLLTSLYVLSAQVGLGMLNESIQLVSCVCARLSMCVCVCVLVCVGVCWGVGVCLEALEVRLCNTCPGSSVVTSVKELSREGGGRREGRTERRQMEEYQGRGRDIKSEGKTAGGDMRNGRDTSGTYRVMRRGCCSPEEDLIPPCCPCRQSSWLTSTEYASSVAGPSIILSAAPSPLVVSHPSLGSIESSAD